MASDATRVDALIQVTAGAPTAEAQGPPRSEVLIMDRSLSMVHWGKLDEAKRAMCAAIDALDDGTHLAVVAGSDRADVIYPRTGGLTRVDAAARKAAKLQVNSQMARGGTAIGSWLACADRLFAEQSTPGAIRHAVLYTDGKNQHETPEELDRVLAACADHFVCDARGLGDDWRHEELLRVTEALHGSPAAVVNVSELTEDFRQLIRHSQHLAVARTYLALRLDRTFQLDFVRQVRPRQVELTSRRQDRNGEVHIPLGSWSPGQRREYQVSLHFDPEQLATGEEIRAANITVHAEREDGSRHPRATPRPLVVVRRSTPGLGIVRSDAMTRVENLRELGSQMQACAAAYRSRDLARADEALRTALELAEETGHTEHVQLLRSVAVRGPDGLLQLRRDIRNGEVEQVGLESTRTGPAFPALLDPLTDPVNPVNPVDPVDPVDPAGAVRRRCRSGHWTVASSAINFCEQCGQPFEQPAPEDQVAPQGGRPGGSDHPQDAEDSDPQDTW